MKRTLFLTALLALTLCGAAGALAKGPAAGSATADDMMALLPADGIGVFYVDVKRAMATPVAQKALDENQEDLGKFMEETGIDPGRDIYCLAGVVSGKNVAEEQSGAVVINLNYDRDALLAKAKEEDADLVISTYEGMTVVEMHDENEDEDPTYAAILDESNLAFGDEEYVLTVIDVYQGKKKSILTNDGVMGLMDDVNRDAILWAAFTVPQEATADLEENPMLGGLKDLKSFVANLDYKDAAITGEIIARAASAETTKQLAEFLRGMKAFGGMMAAEEPEAAEVINAIEVTEGPDFVSLKASIPESIFMKDDADSDDDMNENMNDDDGGW